jgi:hypothetical protein
MARYAITRERNLRGMGTTYSFVPRRRGMRGLGQTSTDIDIVTGLPCDDPRANCGPLFPTTTLPAPTTLTPPPPIYLPPIPVPPPPTNLPPPSPPVMSFPVPGGPLPTIVFPSGGAGVTARPLAAPGWLDQQTIPGISNKFLALGLGFGLLLMAGASSRRGR